MEKVRQIGIITKGLVYAIVGILTLLAAVGMGGSVSGKNEVVGFLQDQIFGKIIVVIVAVGLLFYALFRLYSSFSGKNIDNDKSGYLKRIGYFFSGLIYGSLSISILFSAFASSSGGDSKESATRMVLNQDGGQWILYLVALIIFGVGIYQFYKGFSHKYLEDIDKHGSVESMDLLKKSGRYGHIARGISFGIFAWFVFVAAKEQNADAIRGIEGMFNFLRSFDWGDVLMGLMAAGFILYGIFQYFLARHSKLY
jgi:hypothetical protein